LPAVIQDIEYPDMGDIECDEIMDIEYDGHGWY
jgi:hypothetical protein